MGIPKFFRYISERYPLTSQLITDEHIPEFDNLYLDFNGIIHNCSHPPASENDPHFRLTEEQMFTAIFAYVEHLFHIVRPRKLFFMAVDGVAPRAKMNQQRSRRFRAAKEASELRAKAEAKGIPLPESKPFDSNCITPGTPFMVKLSEQLKYFVNKKITEDSAWRSVEVVLSGHEVPGEGEHKIMEYIRLARTSENHSPNTRHCMYGLDADLIMLSLLSHEPHFCLLREEVKFGPAHKKANGGLESMNFYLLHLSLMREYLDLEFRDVFDSPPKAVESASIDSSEQANVEGPANTQLTTGALAVNGQNGGQGGKVNGKGSRNAKGKNRHGGPPPVPMNAHGLEYDIERIIDDFVLLAVFVGNDFLPNLPDLHIHENALERLFEVYRNVLPAMSGYINEQGKINFTHLQRVLDGMREWEVEIFQREYSDINWLKGKMRSGGKMFERFDNGTKETFEYGLPESKKNKGLVLTPSQRVIFDRVHAFMKDMRKLKPKQRRYAKLALRNDFPAGDRVFLANLVRKLGLDVAWDEYGVVDENGVPGESGNSEEEVNLVVLRFPTIGQSGENGGATGATDGETNGNGGNADGDSQLAEVSRSRKKRPRTRRPRRDRYGPAASIDVSDVEVGRSEPVEAAADVNHAAVLPVNSSPFASVKVAGGETLETSDDTTMQEDASQNYVSSADATVDGTFIATIARTSDVIADGVGAVEGVAAPLEAASLDAAAEEKADSSAHVSELVAGDIGASVVVDALALGAETFESGAEASADDELNEVDDEIEEDEVGDDDDDKDWVTEDEEEDVTFEHGVVDEAADDVASQMTEEALHTLDETIDETVDGGDVDMEIETTDVQTTALNEEDEESEDEEAWAAVNRVLDQYANAPVQDLNTEGTADERYGRRLNEKMDDWKRGYYRAKLEIPYDAPESRAKGEHIPSEELKTLVYRYAEGLQWVMYYYYRGVASWGWFYDYHYAPRISDLQQLDKLHFHFELGTPFRPFEQLMGVLPIASKDHIPRAYQDLMYDPNSPILDFYPLEFELDLNGKKADWEAIVKIPFIDVDRLLSSMSRREHMLTVQEKARNTFGTSTKFTYNPDVVTQYPSSLPGFFPAIHKCLCKMEVFNLPTVGDNLKFTPGLLQGTRTGVQALAGFPSLKTLPHMALLGHHGVNVHGSESRNKSMVIHISNPYDEVIDVCGGQTVVTKPRIKTEEIARRFIGARTFINWPFLQEATVVAVSDNLFRYEKLAVVPGVKPRVVGSPHTHQGIGHFHSKAERIESAYSKRFAVITGNIDVLLHVRPLKGLKRLDNGALVKEYVGPSKETECAVQMAVSKVYSEDPRYLERGAPPLSEEFPDGSKIFFLGEHAYGVAAQVSATTDTTLSVMIAFFPSDKKENEEFKAVVRNSISEAYTPAFQVAKILRMSGRALSRITSSFMVVTSDKQKTNIGLSLKFEAKGLKVIDYSRKNGTHWEFSEKTINLIREYRDKFPHVFECLDASGDAMARGEDLFPDGDSIAQVKAIKAWLKIKGVPNFEPVSLFADKLQQDVVAKLEQLSDTYNTKRSSSNIKKAIVRNIPRQAVLKPAHAVYRLQSQRFALGDRVTMIQDSGAVPLSFKGSVVGLTAKHMDVVWDVPFMAGTTLDNRCSQYRGATVEFAACLNLSDPQFVTSTSVVAPYVQPAVTHPHNPAFKPRIGPHPAIYPTTGNAPAAGFRPAPLRGLGGPPVVHSHHAGPSSQPVIAQPQRVHIMANPHRAQTSATARESGQAQAMHTTASHNTAPAQVQIRGAPPARSLVRGRAQGPVGGSFNSPVRPGEGRGRSANYADTSGRGAGAPFVPRGRPRIFRGRGRATYP